MRFTPAHRLVPLSLTFAASLACDPPVIGPPIEPGADAAVLDQDSPGSGAPDAPASAAGCPVYDVDDPTQVTYGRSSSGPAVLDADTIWTADRTYFVIGSLDVQGVTLTIEAGTHVCLDAGTGAPPTIDLREGIGGGSSRLVVSGTASAPVVFAPATPDSRWNSVTLSASSSASLDQLWLVGGGAGGAGVLRVDENFPEALVARNVHVEDVSGMALSLRAHAGLASDASLFVDSQRAGTSGPAIEVPLHAASTITPASLHLAASLPASARRVQLTNDFVDVDVTLRGDLGVPFVTAGDIVVERSDASTPIPTLTLEAGVEVLFPSGERRVGRPAGLDRDGGNLVALGTAESPIRLGSASDTPAAGDWIGVVIVAGSFEPEVTELRHVVISDAGRDGGGLGSVLHCQTLPTPLTGGIRLRGSTSEPYEGPRLEAIEIVRSAGDGLAFGCTTISCLTTDYAGAVTGTDIAGELLRSRECP